jgi:protein O-mannosyl-transferase
MDRTDNGRDGLLIGVLLAAVTLAVYLPVLQAQFITFDDTLYVTDNPQVQSGLTWNAVRWAFTQSHAANWHPATWLSHMVDCQLYRLKPLGHHLTSLLLHTANTLLLFGLLRRLTGALWRSAFVAALFALHPLHVESVAWVAERKDVLSTCFFLLTLGAYASYARKSEARRPKAKGLPPAILYALALCFFALGLMSKPMLVTVPCVLLLLDYWPLQRFQLKTGGSSVKAAFRLALEKAPFLALSAASCVVTLIAQRKGGALASLEGGSAVSLEARLINTPISYVWYLVKLVWPSDLAVIYPYVRTWPLEKVLLATALLVVVTAVALWQGRRRPYLLVGWLWYLGTLVPVIGLVKVGAQAIADRYMYIPSIGLLVILAWGVADLTASWGHRAVPLGVGALGVLTACALATGAQLLHWQNSESLFRHTLAVTKNNYLACNNLGYYFAQQGQPESAKRFYRAAIEIAPTFLGARNNLGVALISQKKYDEAIATLEELVRISPESVPGRSNLGAALNCAGKADDAVRHLREAIRLNPEYSLAHYNLGNALLQKDKLAEAETEFRLTAKLNPYYAEAYVNLGLALARQGKFSEATAEFKRALALQPNLAPARFGLGEALVDQGKLEEGIAELGEVVRLQPNYQPAWFQLGLAQARRGKLAEAAQAFSAALRLKPDDADAHCQLAGVLTGQHKAREALDEYQAALKLLPDFPEALNNLAWLLATNPNADLRDGRKAVKLAERACRLTDHKQAQLLGTLAAAYAEAGRFGEAAAMAEKAKALADQSNQPELAARNQKLRDLYRAGQPARDTP